MPPVFFSVYMHVTVGPLRCLPIVEVLSRLQSWVHLTCGYLWHAFRTCMFSKKMPPLSRIFPIMQKEEGSFTVSANTADNKMLQYTLKRIGVNSTVAIEEVNMLKDDMIIQR